MNMFHAMNHRKKADNAVYHLCLLLVMFFLMSPISAAAWDHIGNLYLKNQDDLNDLQDGLRKITGALYIFDFEYNINNISKLASLKTVGGDIEIFETQLKDLSSLSNLETVAGTFRITSNPKLTSIGNLSTLKSIGNDFVISYNSSLQNIDTFPSLTTLPKNVTIYDNPSLENIDGLSNLSSVPTIYIRNNAKLENVDGLSQTVPSYMVYINNNTILAEFCGLYHGFKNSTNLQIYIHDNAENPTREQILYDCGSNLINVTVWHDKNENSAVDPDEKGLPDVILRLALTDQVVKHCTNNQGTAFFSGLPDGEKNICIDMASLPAGISCTTGEICKNITVDENYKIVNMLFGFCGNALQELEQDYVIEQIDEYIQPDKLFFVSGSPVYTPAKYDYGWDNLVDESVDPDTGSTWAAVEADAAEKPFGIFEFGDKGFYKFNYVQFQTGNGENSKLAYQAQKIKVMVSTTGTADADFSSIGEFNCTYGVDKMQWCKLADYATAKYIKVCLLSPAVPGKYVQIVEFDVDSDDKSGPISTTLPAAQQENIVEIPDSQPLLSNYPNPFNPSTNIVYQINEDAHVSLRIYDLTGKKVADLVNGAQSSGQYQVTWNASDMPSGVYFMCMQAGTQKATKRILLMK